MSAQESFSVPDFIAAIDSVRATGQGATAEGMRPSVQLLTKLALTGYGGNEQLAAYIRELEAASADGADPDQVLGRLRELASGSTPAPVVDVEPLTPLAEPSAAGIGPTAVIAPEPAASEPSQADPQREHNPLEQTSLEEWLRGSKPASW